MSKKFSLILIAAILYFAGITGAHADNKIPFFNPYPVIDKSAWYISNGWANGDHQGCEWREKAISASDNAIRLTLSNRAGKTRKYSCGEIQSTNKYGYGRYETRMKASIGSGLNSAFFTYIGPTHHVKEHDEIDFEFLGKDAKLVQVGYWHDAKNYDVKVIDLGFDASKEFHDYAFEWTRNHIIWYVDGKEVHRTSPNNPMPRNRQKIFFSLWSGTKMIDDWLGRYIYSGTKHMDVMWVKYTSIGTGPE